MAASSYTLKTIPPDVYELIQKEQSLIKEKKGTAVFSFERTLYKMIKDYDRCRDVSEKFSEGWNLNMRLNKEVENTTSYSLKEIPNEVYKIICAEQYKIKLFLDTGSFSFESTIYQMIRDYDRCRKETKTFKPEPV
jgi:hypothetical protein